MIRTGPGQVRHMLFRCSTRCYSQHVLGAALRHTGESDLDTFHNGNPVKDGSPSPSVSSSIKLKWCSQFLKKIAVELKHCGPTNTFIQCARWSVHSLVHGSSPWSLSGPRMGKGSVKAASPEAVLSFLSFFSQTEVRASYTGPNIPDSSSHLFPGASCSCPSLYIVTLMFSPKCSLGPQVSLTHSCAGPFIIG